MTQKEKHVEHQSSHQSSMQNQNLATGGSII